MSLIDTACRAVLAANAGVTALVGQRIYPDRLPTEPTLPALTYSLISEVLDAHISGDRRARVQVSCWDDPEEHAGVRSPATVTAVAEAVISALSRTALQKQVSSWTLGATAYTVTKCRCTNAPRLLEDETDYYHVPCDFEIEFRT
ncbi:MULTISPECIES: DUF3168 domain-containing protein [unclassified Methanoculleus]|uniref:DUF3168 domain-containing protein n=1 Tax=unclassified Methanoculleus TaxID=2619537 RepID=UPI0025FED346|nr:MULTISPECIES: DUF3168 domain-containing protein [unclassified Methanoculleus]